MLPIRLFRSRGFSAGDLVSFMLFASNLSLTFFFAQFQQVGLGQDPLEAAPRLLPWTGAFVLLAPRAGAIADRVGERPMIVAGMAGIGTAMATPAAERVVVGAVPPAEIGRASGTFATARWFGCVFGIAVAAVAVSAGFAVLGGLAGAAPGPGL